MGSFGLSENIKNKKKVGADMARTVEDVLGEVRGSPLKEVFSKKVLAMGLFVIVFLPLVFMSGKIFETNDAGFTKLLQAAGTGTLSVHSKPGMFPQFFGDVYTYKMAEILYFSKHEDEGRSLDEAISVRFNDGATANVTGNVRVELPNDPEKIIDIHKKFRSYDALIKDTVKQVVSESVILTAALMTAEESYTTKRAEFSQMADDQAKNGIYLTESYVIEAKDAKTGEVANKQLVRIQRDEQGNPKRKEAVLAKYGIHLGQFIIKDIDYQKEVHDTINKKQGALMMIVAAKAAAEGAVQDRLTAEETGKKNVAVAKYTQEVEKVKAVTAAEQQLEVSRLDKQRAEMEKQTKILQAEGEGEYRRKIMVADGALQQKLNAYVETQKAWADAYSKRAQPDVPSVIMGSGANGGNAANEMMNLLSIKAARDLSLELKPRAQEK